MVRRGEKLIEGGDGREVVWRDERTHLHAHLIELISALCLPRHAIRLEAFKAAQTVCERGHVPAAPRRLPREGL